MANKTKSFICLGLITIPMAILSFTLFFFFTDVKTYTSVPEWLRTIIILFSVIAAFGLIIKLLDRYIYYYRAVRFENIETNTQEFYALQYQCADAEEHKERIKNKLKRDQWETTDLSINEHNIFAAHSIIKKRINEGFFLFFWQQKGDLTIQIIEEYTKEIRLWIAKQFPHQHKIKYRIGICVCKERVSKNIAVKMKTTAYFQDAMFNNVCLPVVVEMGTRKVFYMGGQDSQRSGLKKTQDMIKQYIINK